MGLQSHVRLLIITYCALLSVACTFPYRPGYDRNTASYPSVGPKGKVQKAEIGKSFSGKISYYGPKFHGRKTANGERFDQNALTCAHKTLPFGTLLLVKLESTGKSVKVRVNDRGPYKGNRILDLSLGAAKAIGLVTKGVGKATIKTIQP